MVATLISGGLSAWGHPCAADIKNSLKFCQKVAMKIHHMTGRSYYTDCKPSIEFCVCVCVFVCLYGGGGVAHVTGNLQQQ